MLVASKYSEDGSDGIYYAGSPAWKDKSANDLEIRPMFFDGAIGLVDQQAIHNALHALGGGGRQFAAIPEFGDRVKCLAAVKIGVFYAFDFDNADGVVFGVFHIERIDKTNFRPRALQ
jgi:hypothetical protein